MRGADASAGTIKSGGKTRRAAKMVVLDVDHPDVEEFIWCKAHEEEKARVLEAAGYDMSLDSPDWASIQYQNANNSVRVTDAFMEAAVDGRRVEPHRAHRRHRRRDDGRARPAAARSPRRRGSAPTRASSTTRRSTRGTRCPNTGRINASNPCSEYMSIDDSACNLASLNLMKFRREDGELDVEAFEHAVDVDVPRAGDPRRLLVVPDARDRGEREGVPPARPRLREPRRAADGARAPVRLRRRPRVRRRDHRADDRPRVPQVGRDRRAHGPVRRLPQERGRDDRRDREAPRGGRQHRDAPTRSRPTCSPRAARRGTTR